MSVFKSLTLATVLILVLTVLADAASRARLSHRSQPVPRTYSTRAVPAQGRGGYSSNPRNRALQGTIRS
jgi:hypothetical protein